MALTLHELMQDREAVLALDPEELAGYILECFNHEARSRRNEFHAGNFGNSIRHFGEEIVEACLEAWAWLVREGMLVPMGESSGSFYRLSRRGRRLAGRTDLEAWRKSALLPKAMLHPVVAQKCWSAFLRGEYDTAVFQAFKEVEVAVRNAGGFAPTDIGVPLMREAFDASSGPLRDAKSPESERQAIAHLFAGAIGAFKNPSSHRTVGATSREAVELMFVASHLMYLVDGRQVGSP